MNIADITPIFHAVSWREPLWLLLAFVPLLIGWIHFVMQPRQTRFADSHLMPWIVLHQHTKIWRRVFSKNSAFILAWLFFGIAASGPRLPMELAAQQQATDMDIMLVVDVSRSMHVNDISPSRIRRAQIEIEELLERSAGKRIGVIVFAARPHLLVPLTSDHDALRFYLRTLDSLVLPTQGSEPAAALELAQQELRDSTNPSAIIMLTDGDFSTMPDAAISTLNAAAIPLYLLGIGSIEGDAIPLTNGTWLQHDGRPVISRLNQKGLRHMASLSVAGDVNDNHYSPALDDDSDWQQLYDRGVARLAARLTDTNTDHHILWQELYHWPLFFGLILLWLSLMPYGLRLHPRFTVDALLHSAFSKTGANVNTKTAMLVSSIVLLSLYPQQENYAANVASVNPAGPVNESQAFENFSNGNYPAALSIYKQLSGFTARLGAGSSHYKMADYNGALRQFSQAVLAANNDKQRAVALFNLGNSYFQTGNYAAALTVYQDALRYQPARTNILHNLRFTRALKKAVDERLQQTAPAARRGSGSLRAPTTDATQNNQSGLLSIDENENKKPEDFPLPELANISNAALETLIKKGLDQIKLAATDVTSAEYTFRQRDKLAFINAWLRMSDLEDQQALLWKRLFEIEEGFPAPLSEPRQVPGVNPW
jgi:Ca-activated chloride channel family protein